MCVTDPRRISAGASPRQDRRTVGRAVDDRSLTRGVWVLERLQRASREDGRPALPTTHHTGREVALVPRKIDAPIGLRHQPYVAVCVLDQFGVTICPDAVVDVPGSDSHLRSL